MQTRPCKSVVILLVMLSLMLAAADRSAAQAGQAELAGEVRDANEAAVRTARVILTDLTETINVEFRTEIFNFTNTPPLGNPSVVLGAAGFGSITTAGDPRVIQFGLKLNF